MNINRFVKHFLKSFSKSKTRFVMLMFVICVGVTSFNGLIMAYQQLYTTYETSYRDYCMADFTITTTDIGGQGAATWFDYNNATEVMNELMQNHSDIIESYELRIVQDMPLNVTTEDQGYWRLFGRIIGYNASSLRKPSVNSFKLSGDPENYFLESDLDPTIRNACLVETHLYDYFKLAPGSTIYVGNGNIPFFVIGRAASPEYIINTAGFSEILPSPRRFGVIFAPLQTVQRLLNAGTKVNEVSVLLKSGTSKTQLYSIMKLTKEVLESKRVGAFLSEPIEMDFQPGNYLLRLDLAEAREMGVALPILIMGMAAAGLYVLLSRMVTADRKEIGISRALGYSRRYIMLQYMTLAMGISLVGTTIGTISGVLLAQAFTPLYLSFLDIRFEAQTDIDLIVIALGFAAGIFTGFIGGYFPSKSAVKMIPAESLRYDPSLQITSGKTPLLERFLNKLRFYPKTSGLLKIPIRNLFRSRRRTISSMLGIIVSVSIVSMGLGMIDTLTLSLFGYYENVETWNVRVDYDDLITNASDIVETLEKWDGVSVVESSMTSGGIVYGNSDKSKAIQLSALTPNQLNHKFEFIGSGSLNPEGIIVSKPIMDALNLEKEDNITLETVVVENMTSLYPPILEFKLRNYSLPITGVVDEFNGLVLYLSKSTLINLFDPNEIFLKGYDPTQLANVITIKMEDPSPEKLENFRNKMYSELDYNVRAIAIKKEYMGDLAEMMDLLYALMYVFAAFGIVLSMALIYNTVYINLQEREREIATLRTVGTSRRKLIGIVTVENLFTLVLGLILGFIFGYFLLIFFLELILNMEFFRLKVFMSMNTIIITSLSALIGVLIAQMFPLRRSLTLNLAESTKSREQ